MSILENILGKKIMSIDEYEGLQVEMNNYKAMNSLLENRVKSLQLKLVSKNTIDNKVERTSKESSPELESRGVVIDPVTQKLLDEHGIDLMQSHTKSSIVKSLYPPTKLNEAKKLVIKADKLNGDSLKEMSTSEIIKMINNGKLIEATVALSHKSAASLEKK